MIFYASALFVLICSFIFQEFIPALPWAHYSTLLLVHTIFYTSAVCVPFPIMLGFAFVAGYIWDCRYYLPVQTGEAAAMTGQFEIPFGMTILIFGIMGAVLQGVRPFFGRGRWELPIFMVGVCTLVGLLIQFLVISFQRGDFGMGSEFWVYVFLTSFFSLLVAPLILFLFSRIAGALNHKIYVDGIARRYNSHGDTI